MPRSLFDHARTLTRRLLGPKRRTPRSRRETWVRPTLEVLEDRVLLSASTPDTIVQLPALGSAQVSGNSTGYSPGIEPVATPGSLVGSPHGQSFAGGSGLPSGFSPQQISQAYGFNQITFNNGTIKGDGSGQTIAIVDAFNQPNIAGDLQTFDSTYGLAAPPSFTVLNQTGGSSLPATDTSWGVEESLDVEWAHAMAPGANIVLVEANSANWGDLVTATNYARNLPGVSVVSLSWGVGEFSNEPAFDSYFTTPGGHNGVTFVAASGDAGASSLSYPSTSPNVLAVGGTQLTTDAAGNYQSETGWSGSGGGTSAVEAQPTYQNGVVTQNSTSRAVPDVAYNGSSSSAYGVYDTSGYGGWIPVYGTSAGTPQWAALVAIADQGRALAGEGTLDGATQTLPAIYQMPGSNFHDVTTGGNGANSAGPGYDLVTGRGTPIANRVVSSLVTGAATLSQAQTLQQVSLSGSYNRAGIVSDGSHFGGGLDGSGHALSANLLGPSVNWSGFNFTLGPTGSNDVISATGQTISLPSGSYSALAFLADAVNGNQAGQTFTVHYTDGTSQTFTQSVSDWATPQNYAGESRAVTMSYRDNANGTRDTRTLYVYGYQVALNPSKQVQSITLPYDSNLEVLAMTLAQAQPQQQVSLGGSYNRAGIASDGATFGGGLDGSGHALSANLLGPSVNWSGYNFALGPTGSADVISATGQTISLPSGSYSALAFLADGVNGNQTGLTFTVHYSDGTSQTFTQSVSDWATPQNYPGETRVVTMSYRDNANGTRDTRALYVYGYRFVLNPSKQVESITLPNDPNLELLAIDLA
jgi:hypothetical protein